MKDLSYSELLEAPSAVQYIHMMGTINQPIGCSFFDETVAKYPEYFPDEIESKRKWDLVPQSVRDTYWKEYWEFREKLWENEPKPVGIMGCVNNTKEYKKWAKAYKRLRPLEKKKEKELHEKHYSKYGISP